MAAHSIRDIAAALGAEAAGAVDLVVTGLAEPRRAGPEHLALAMKPEYVADLAAGRARAAVVAAGMDWRALGLEAAIVVARPRYAMAGLTAAMDPGPALAPGIHPGSLVDPSATIGPGAAVGPFVVIGAGVRIGARARIASHCSIGAGARIGDDALILEGVRIGHDVRIGDRVIVQPGAVLGGDGFSFVTPEKGRVETARETLGKAAGAEGDAAAGAGQSWTRIHSLGSLVLGDDVEIGANATLDRGTVSDTEIGDGTKIDNLVHVGHNCRIGRDCLICGQTGLAGSVVMGDRVVLGGKCGVSDNLVIGSDVVAAGSSKIYTNVPAGRMVMGDPAVKMDLHLEMYKATRRLPRLARSVADLQKAVFKSDKTS